MFWAIEQFLNRDKKAVNEYIQTLEEQARTSGVIQVGTMRFAVIDPASATAGTAEAGVITPLTIRVPEARVRQVGFAPSPTIDPLVHPSDPFEVSDEIFERIAIH